MFLFRLFVIIVFATTFMYSQISWIPDFPTSTDSIVITFDASEGNKGLMGYTGDVYAHTGVITNLSTSGTDWKYVKTDWGQNTPETKLERIGTDLYTFKIKPTVQAFYGVPSSEQILQVAFVFRSGVQVNGSWREGKTDTGGDIYLPISQGGLNVSITSPEKVPYFTSLNDTININVVSSGSDSLFLYANGTKVFQTASNEISFNFVSTQHGKTKFIAEAKSGSTSQYDSTYIVVNSPITIESVPAGIEYGINYISSTSVTLHLYAPEKEFVYVIGDFTNWEVDPEFYMKRSPDTREYWLNIDGLDANKEYIFQYLVDGEIRIADPYAEKVLDPRNDEYISESVYPNLIDYPTGKTTEYASVLQTNQQQYQWKVLDFERPKKTDLVIYELLIRDFINEHSYNALIDTLGYLKRLGVNVIELMPVMEFGGNESWGYNTIFHFAPDKYYGTKNDLKKFVDEAHKQGFAVILDIVLNHVYGESPLVRLYWNSTLNRPAENNPWFNEVSPNQTFSFGFDFNHEQQVVKEYVDRVNKYWLTEYKVDGFRFDFTKGFTNTPGDGGAYDTQRILILNRMAGEIKKVDSTAFIILEHFAPNSEETVLSNNGMMLWGNVNYNYNEASMGYVANSNFSGVSYKSRGWLEPNLVAYMESHDEERLMFKNLQYGNSSGDYNVKDLLEALQRMKMTAAFYLLVPGPKMIWQFGELGYDYSINYPTMTSSSRTSNKPIRWDYYNISARQKLYKTFSALNTLKQNEAFETNNFTLQASGYIKKLNINHETMDVYVIGNFDVQARSTTHSFTTTGYWYNYFTGDSILVDNASAEVSLQPGEFYVYTSVNVPHPDPDIITDIKNHAEETTVSNFNLLQNYPNPFNPYTTIEYQLPVNNHVVIKIYDVLGREVTTLVNEYKTAGKYSVVFDASSLASGTYMYRLVSGDFVSIKKMQLLK